MYVYIPVYTFMCIYTRTNTHTPTHTHTYTHLLTHIYAQIRSHTHLCKNIYFLYKQCIDRPILMSCMNEIMMKVL